MWFGGHVPDSPATPSPDNLPPSRETVDPTAGAVVDAPAGVEKAGDDGEIAGLRDRILSPKFTKMLGELYPKIDWQLGVPAGTMSMINDVKKLQPSWLDSVTGISADLAELVPTSPLLDSLVPTSRLLEGMTGTARPWMDTAFRMSAEIESLIPSPVVPQSLIDSLIVSQPALTSAASTIDAMSSLGGIPALNVPAWFEPLIARSEAFRSAVEIASLGKVYGLPADLFEPLRFLNLPSLAESKRHLPRNWRSVDVDPDEIESEVREILEEGIPLAWIPAPRVIDLLLDAPDAAARRRVIANNHRGILTSCEQLAGRLSSPKALHYADIVRSSVRALRDGHTEAAQALASSLLDTVVGNHSRDALGLALGSLKNASAYTVTRKRGWRFTLALHPLTVVMSGTHTTKKPTRRYNRNATVHAITRQQYTRVNAVLAIMNATAVLTCFVRDTPAFD